MQLACNREAEQFICFCGASFGSCLSSQVHGDMFDHVLPLLFFNEDTLIDIVIYYIANLGLTVTHLFLPWPNATQPRTVQEMMADPFPCRECFFIFSPVPSLSEANSQTRSLSKRLTDGAKLGTCDGPFDYLPSKSLKLTCQE